jgi:prefoldin beta subunit
MGAHNSSAEELRFLESQLQSILAQKQAIQMEINEVENALSEVKHSDEEVYKIVSGFMIRSEKKQVAHDLGERKKLLEMKIVAIEKQESLLEKNLEELRSDTDDEQDNTEKMNE